MNHVSFETLVDYAEDRLGEAERRRVEEHIADCPRCAEQAAAVRRMLESLEAGELSAPPRGLLRP